MTRFHLFERDPSGFVALGSPEVAPEVERLSVSSVKRACFGA